MVVMYLTSSKRINSMEKIKLNPNVKTDNENPTKRTKGSLGVILPPENMVISNKAMIPIKKLTKFERTLERQNNRASTRIFMNIPLPLEIESAACMSPWVKNVRRSTPASR